jgi:predicted lipoprotein with Yx(FWY)xxD motif
MSTHRRKIAVAGALLTVGAAAVGPALAGTSTPTVKAKANAALGKTIVVDAKGRTLYRLSGESKTHLKCTVKACLGFWPPLTVASSTTKLRAGSGVTGRLSLLHRSDGTLQVMLGGKPLYRCAGDHAATASGEGLVSYGGTWNVLRAGASSGTTTPAPPTPPPAYGAY